MPSRLRDLAVALGAARLARALRQTPARILAYHGVDPIQDPQLNADGFQVAPEVFEAQLDHLQRHYQVVPLSVLVDGIAGRGALPPNVVALTFDDGYANNRHVVAPILQRRKLPAAFFVTIGFIEGTCSPWWYRMRAVTPPAEQEAVASRLKSLSNAARESEMEKLGAGTDSRRGLDAYPMMNWAEVRELAELGFEVGAHTVNHPSLAAESPEVQETEIRQSLEQVASHAGSVSRCFSVPYGRGTDLSDRVVDILRSAGCSSALTTSAGLNQMGADVMRLKRLNVCGHHRGSAFESLVSGLTGIIRRE